jgi:RimJ/RimL family protein N-acetyltransferase
MNTIGPVVLRTLQQADTPAFRTLRLRALEESPSAFGADLQDERAMALGAMAARIAPGDNDGSGVLGAFDGDDLVAVAGLHRQHGAKNRHIAFIWSVYVAPGYRGTGLGRRLLQRTIDLAREIDGLRRVNLTVNASNAAAFDLYRSLGFVEYGRMPESLFVGGIFHDEILMTLELASQACAEGLA